VLLPFGIYTGYSVVRIENGPAVRSVDIHAEQAGGRTGASCPQGVLHPLCGGCGLVLLFGDAGVQPRDVSLRECPVPRWVTCPAAQGAPLTITSSHNRPSLSGDPRRCQSPGHSAAGGAAA